MLTIAEEIYPHEHRLLKAVIDAIEERNPPEAGKRLEEARQAMEALASPAHKLQMELFINALRSRLNHAMVENLYLVPDEGQQIRMFNIMAEKFPVVRSAQEIANGLFVSRLTGSQAFTILDIGIGTGQQMAGLVQKARDSLSALQTIRIIGIEPSADSLGKARERFRELSAGKGPRIEFEPLHKTVEQLDEGDWQRLTRHATEPGSFLVNASFALHHVHPLDFRTALFQRLQTLKPAAFVIIEPYADYLAADLPTRFRNAWHHYGLTFRAIDTIDAGEEEKSAVKRIFFGREMMDVLSEGERIEQFETAEMWIQRLQAAGFRIEPVRNTLAGSINPVIRVEERPSYLGFNVDGHPVVAVICAG